MWKEAFPIVHKANTGKHAHALATGITIVQFIIKQGHGTRNGGYVPPNDFITPIVDKAAKDLSKKIGGK